MIGSLYKYRICCNVDLWPTGVSALERPRVIYVKVTGFLLPNVYFMKRRKSHSIDGALLYMSCIIMSWKI